MSNKFLISHVNFKVKLHLTYFDIFLSVLRVKLDGCSPFQPPKPAGHKAQRGRGGSAHTRAKRGGDRSVSLYRYEQNRVEEQKKEIWQLKLIASENEKNKNLLCNITET